MENAPAVPNWLQWVAIFIAIGGVVFAAFKYSWNRWFSDIWAKRNQNAAKDQATLLIKQLEAAWSVLNDDRRFHALSTILISDCIIGVFFLVLSTLVNYFDLFLFPYNSLFLQEASGFFLSVVLFIFGIYFFLKGIDRRQKYVIPFVKWEEYFEQTVDRIDTLLVKAGLDTPEKKSKFIADTSEAAYDMGINSDNSVDLEKEDLNGSP